MEEGLDSGLFKFMVPAKPVVISSHLIYNHIYLGRHEDMITDHRLGARDTRVLFQAYADLTLIQKARVNSDLNEIVL